MKVWLVNTRHAKNVPGRKSDVRDCQWLQHFHSAGLLRPSFRPERSVAQSVRECAIATVWCSCRRCTCRICQESLDQMNLQLHHVISDDLGRKTSMSIIGAIFAGKRDPRPLAALCDPRTKASEQTSSSCWRATIVAHACSHCARR